jgi:hypothetical protein
MGFPKIDLREILVYCNFGVGSNSLRPKIWKQMLDKEFVLCERPFGCQPQDMERYFRQISNSDFVICPPGNGPDTYRMWEALMLGAIPIVLKHPMMDHFKHDVPILQVDDYNQLTEQFLFDQYQQLSSMHYRKNFLKKAYWRARWLRDIED